MLDARATPAQKTVRSLLVLLFISASVFSLIEYQANQKAISMALLGIAIAALVALSWQWMPDTDTPRAAARPDAQEAGIGLTALIDAMPQPTLLLDTRLFVHGHNKAAASLFPNLKTGEPLSFAVRTPELLNALRSGAQGHFIQIEYNERIPVDSWRRASVSPVRSPAAPLDTTHILLTLDDLTPLRRAERMRVDFVANASHELRTPLASLLGFIETLQGPAREDAAARGRFLTIMHDQAKRMARLVDDLLSLSSIEQKQHLPVQADVNLNEVLAHVRDALQPLAQASGVAIKLIAPGTLVSVTGDRDDLIRLVENLSENAIKYGQSGKKVELELMQLPAETVLHVRDFGPGIHAEHVPRLTERFYRVNAEESRDKGGTGLGLAIVKHILTRHNGRLAIASTLGEGTTFTVTLPAYGRG
jgi:two-component system, OmpR family, phosphate regulon sensor histidine kinase PhoR